MIEKSNFLTRGFVLAGMIGIVMSASGCALENALLDGVFAGVSDTVSFWIASAAGAMSP